MMPSSSAHPSSERALNSRAKCNRLMCMSDDPSAIPATTRRPASA